MIEWWWILVAIWVISVIYMSIFIEPSRGWFNRVAGLALSPFLLFYIFVLILFKKAYPSEFVGTEKLRLALSALTSGDRLEQYKKGKVFLSVNRTKYEIPDDKKKRILAILLKED